MAKKPSDNRQRRQQRILDAGLELFLSNGIRGTSMEAIAKAAEVAKPTLYNYFADKDDIFEAIVKRLVARFEEIVAAALSQDAPLVTRISDLLRQKHVLIYTILEGSPHAAELYSAPKYDRKSAFTVFEKWLRDQLSAALETEGYADAQFLAQVLCASTDGIARHAQSVDDIERAITVLVAKLLTVSALP